MSFSDIVKTTAENFANTFKDRLIGALPTAQGSKFGRTVYPHMAAQAQLTQLNVYAFWFGDTFQVTPLNGQTINLGFSGNINSFESAMRIRDREGESFFVFRCPSQVDFDNIREVSDICFFDPVGVRATQIDPIGRGGPPFPIQQTEGIGIGTLAVVGLVAFFALGKGNLGKMGNK